jgi:hypothetical protein
VTLTLAEWRALPKWRRAIIDHQRYHLTLDRESGATVLEPVHITGTTQHRREA